MSQVESSKRHYLKNKSQRIADVKTRKDDVRAKVNVLKETSPCTDCEVFYPHYVMHFDHLKDKTREISKAITYGWSFSRILIEIEKCELVCANCHAIRTWNRIH